VAYSQTEVERRLTFCWAEVVTQSSENGFRGSVLCQKDEDCRQIDGGTVNRNFG
jgi:hypothetical protein